MAWRFYAQRARTKAWLHTDVALSDVNLSWTLSGAGQLSATVANTPDLYTADDGRPLFEEWSTLLYAEDDGVIRWGGIVVATSFDGPNWKIEAASFATYPHGIPYTGIKRFTYDDPITVVREIWRHIQQDYPAGDLDLTVVGSSTGKIGTTAEPYDLVWWEAKDCGDEIDSLSGSTTFDYTEAHDWNAEGTDVTHRLICTSPRAGRRRDDLSFVLGENIDRLYTVERSGDDYANEVVGIGAGEGRAIVTQTVSVDDGRLRRAAVYSDKMIRTTARMRTILRRDMARRRVLNEITGIEVRGGPNAPIASWNLGDDILVQGSLPYLGDIAIWHRIVGWSLIGEHRAKLELQRSDGFIFGGDE